MTGPVQTFIKHECISAGELMMKGVIIHVIGNVYKYYFIIALVSVHISLHETHMSHSSSHEAHALHKFLAKQNKNKLQ